MAGLTQSTDSSLAQVALDDGNGISERVDWGTLFEVEQWTGQTTGQAPDDPDGALGALEQTVPAQVFQVVEDLSEQLDAEPQEIFLAAFRVLIRRHIEGPALRISVRYCEGDSPGPVGDFEASLVSTLPHPEATFREIVRTVPDSLSAGGFLGAPVGFSFQREPDSAAVPDASASLSAARIRQDRHDLALTVVHGPARSAVVWTYDERALSSAVVSRLAERFQVLLASLPESVDLPIATVPIMTAADRAQLRVAGTPVDDLPLDGSTLVDLFDEQAARRPAAAAVRQGDELRSYADVLDVSERVASWLSGLGLAAETCVGLALRRTVDMPAVVLGVLRAGLAAVPLDVTSPVARNATILRDAEAGLLIQDSLGGSLVPGAWETVSLVELRQALPAAERDRTARSYEADSLAYVVYTSGSTGSPKGVAVNNGSLANCLRATRDQLDYQPGMTWLAVSRTAFDISLLELFTPLVSGGVLLVSADDQVRDGDRLREALKASRPDYMQATPAVWQMLHDSGWSGDPGLIVSSGGDVVSPALADRLIRENKAFWHTYGPTEATLYCVSTRLTSARGYRVLPIGRPLPNTRLYVVDERLQPVPPGVVGELCIAGAALARGYLRLPELTAERFIEDSPLGERVYRTGDRAVVRLNGEIELRGRRDGQVKLRGYRIELGEIEAVLARHPAVAAVAVARVGDDPETHRLAAYVQLAPDAGGAGDGGAVHELTAHAARYLSPYMLPSSYHFLDRLPLTPNDKIDRRALPGAGGRSAERDAPAEPRTGDEGVVAEVWTQLLGLVTVSDGDNFFELGGNSLLAVKAVSLIKKRLGVRISTWTMFEAPTIPELTAAVRAARLTSEESDD